MIDKALTVENGNFSWDSSESKELVLRDINLNVERGQLVAVVGTVGSGKSSLVSALLGEMEKLSGRINIKVFLSPEVFNNPKQELNLIN